MDMRPEYRTYGTVGSRYSYSLRYSTVLVARQMAGVEGCSVVARNTKKSDFGSYSLYLALHEGFLRYCTGSISVRYFQVARGIYGRVEGCSVVVQHKKV